MTDEVPRRSEQESKDLRSTEKNSRPMSVSTNSSFRRVETSDIFTANSSTKYPMQRRTSLRFLIPDTNDEDKGNKSESSSGGDLREKEVQEATNIQTGPATSRRGYFGRSKSMLDILGDEKENPSPEKAPARHHLGSMRRGLSRKSLMSDVDKEANDCSVDGDQENKTTPQGENDTRPGPPRRGCFGRSRSVRHILGDETEDVNQTKTLGPCRGIMRRLSSRRLLISETEKDSADGDSLSDDRSDTRASTRRDRLSKMKMSSYRSCTDDLSAKIQRNRGQLLQKSKSFDESLHDANTISTESDCLGLASSIVLKRSKSCGITQSDETWKMNSFRKNQSRSFRASSESEMLDADNQDKPASNRRLLSNFRSKSKQNVLADENETDKPLQKAEKDEEVASNDRKNNHGMQWLLLITTIFSYLWQNPAAKLAIKYTLDAFFFLISKAVGFLFWLLAAVVDGIRISSQWLINQHVVREALVAVYTRGESIKKKKTE